MNFNGSRLGFWFRPQSRISRTKVLVFYDPTTYYVGPTGTVFQNFYTQGDVNPETDIWPNIQSREIAAGYQPELVIGYENLPADMNVYSHVWDIGYVSPYLQPYWYSNPWTDPTNKLTTFIQDGGSMFMLGENIALNSPGSYPELTRWETITSFLTQIGANQGPTNIQMNPVFFGFVTCMIKPDFLIANNNNMVEFAAPGSWLDTGTDGNGNPTGISMTTPAVGGQAYPAAMWETGSLSNAPAGAIISVLDVNFLTDAFLQNDFIDNIIASLMQR